jgi:Uma2 family endonuclease
MRMVATKVDFERFARDHPERRWELHRGQLREKPDMSAEHNHVLWELATDLTNQLARDRFKVRVNTGLIATSAQGRYVPDLYVVPAEQVLAARRRADPLEIYADSLPLVVEVWSPSTGNYDVDEKLPEYMARGDREIWRLHPGEHTLRGWRRRADGEYDEFTASSGVVEPQALPGVRIDLDAIFTQAE